MKANEIETDITQQEIARLVDELFPVDISGKRRFCVAALECIPENAHSKMHELAAAALALAKGEAYIP